MPPQAVLAREDYVRARLPSIPGFDELTTDRLREIARQIHVLECDQDELLFDAGASPGPLVVVTAGSARVETTDAQPLRTTVAEDGYVGALSVMFRERRMARARANGPLEAFVVPPGLVRNMMREGVSMRRHLTQLVATRAAALLPHTAPQLAAMERSACMTLLGCADFVTIEDGELLQLEGSHARAMYMIVGGRADVSGDGMTAAGLDAAWRGDVVGADSLRADAPATVTVRAATAMMVARISRAAFCKFASGHAAAADAIRDSRRTR